MAAFYDLKIKHINRETIDSVTIEFDVPENLKSEFNYKPGQYLTFKHKFNGNEIRRSYSICSSPYANEALKVAVKVVPNGVFSTFANSQLKAGDILSVMPPAGNFTVSLNNTNAKHYVGFAAGSGITPLMSIIKSVLLVEPKSKFHLIYGNKNLESTIFKNEFEELKNNSCFKLTNIYSKIKTGDALTEGRIDNEKSKILIDNFQFNTADEFFICGPENMIIAVNDALQNAGVEKSKIHFELFTTPIAINGEKSALANEFKGTSRVTVLMYGEKTEFDLPADGQCILDASIDAGVDAPFACKGAVCCTCKAKIIEGKAMMDMNYALSDEEVNAGFILTCQAHPQSEKLIVDFDV